MTKQTTGWNSRSIRRAAAARTARNQLIARLKRERVSGDEHTPAELVSLRDERLAETKSRNPEWFRA